jgi:transposase
MTAIDDPSRFRRSRDVAAYFGLTSKRRQSGATIDVQGRIIKAGDPEMRRALFEAAGVMLTRFKGNDKLKAWGFMLAKRGCRRKATVAVARKMAVVMHAMWRDGAVYVGDATTREEDVAARAAVKNRKLLGAHS